MLTRQGNQVVDTATGAVVIERIGGCCRFFADDGRTPQRFRYSLAPRHGAWEVQIMDSSQPGDVVGLCCIRGDLSIIIVTPSFLEWRGSVEAVEFVFNPGFTAIPSLPN